MSRFAGLALLSLSCVGSIGAAEAQEWTLTLDPEGTEIRFKLGATLHEVKGALRLLSGEVLLNSASGFLSGHIVIDSRSANTGNPKRDDHMHLQVLESESFPEFTFAPREFSGSFELSGLSRLLIKGELTVHGGVHSISLPVDVSVDGNKVTVETSLRIPYVEWGMKDPSKLMLRVKKHVDVEVEAVGTLRPLP